MSINKVFFLFFLSFFFQFEIYSQHTNYFVDQQNGSNINSGITVSQAFKSFNTAVDHVQPGDTIKIVGVYHNPDYNSHYNYSAPDDAHLWHAENTLKISNLNGNANAYITITSYDNNTKLLGDGANIIRITNSSYLRIENLEIEGEVDRIPLSTSLAMQFVYIIANNSLIGTETDPAPADIHYRNLDETNDNDGVVEETDVYTDISNLPVKRPTYIDTRGLYVSNSNNLKIINNKIHHTPGGGLRVADSKNIEILENEIYHCSARSYSGTHALVVTKTKPIGSNKYSISIERNNVHHNYNEIFSWSPKKTKITPRIDEGKGISLQRNNVSSWINGQGKILVANNLCYWNGFSGVHSNDGYRIDMFNNTCFMNSYTNTVTYAGQAQQGKNIGISCQRSHNIKIINNISVIDTDWNGFAISASNTSSNIQVSDNLIYGINGTATISSNISATHLINQNPLFVNVPSNYQDENYDFDFHLDATSPAIDQGNSSSFIPSIDYFKNQRDMNPDIGAVEFITLSINNPIEESFIIYPNPTTKWLYIKNLSTDIPYKIYDVSGKILLQSLTNKFKISLEDLKNGVYFLKIENRVYQIIKE